MTRTEQWLVAGIGLAAVVVTSGVTMVLNNASSGSVAETAVSIVVGLLAGLMTAVMLLHLLVARHERLADKARTERALARLRERGATLDALYEQQAAADAARLAQRRLRRSARELRRRRVLR